jgi:DNA-binding MarR family transcriptional regulator
MDGEQGGVAAQQVASVVGPDLERLVEEVLACGSALTALTARALRTAASDISTTQHRLLATLDTHGPARMVHLAHLLDVDPSSLGRLCERLIRKDLVERRRNHNDRRIVIVSLTENGQRVLVQVSHARRTAVRTVAAALGDDARATVMAGLWTWTQACRAANGQPP